METLKCPRCSRLGLQRTQPDQLLCGACGARFVMTSRQAGPLVACPHCGFGNEPRASVCCECRTALAKYCPRCGAMLELAMRFCDQCGANQESLTSPEGRCQWCGSQNDKEADACDQCGASLIVACPRCEAKMKAGLNYCKACGLDYATLLETDEDEP